MFFSRLLLELVAPFNLALLILSLALCFLIIRKNNIGRGLFVCGLGILLLGGYGVGFRSVLQERENRFSPITQEQLSISENQEIKYIVVLGSSHVSDSRLPVNSQIGSTSLLRLVEGIRVHRVIPNSTLIFCGWAVYDPVPNANVVRDVAL